MNPEQGPRPEKEIDWTAEHQRRRADLINAFAALRLMEEEDLDELKPSLDFDSYIRKNPLLGLDPEEELLNADSDLRHNFNVIVAKLNSDRERIMKERDLSALTQFLDQCDQLLRHDAVRLTPDSAPERE